MKKTLLIGLMAFAGYANATVRTVNNRIDGGAQFSSLQTAIDNSANGDTIYMHGSQDSYGNVTIADKALTLIGPGFAPAKDNPLTAIVGDINLTNSKDIPGDNNGSEIQGLVVNSVSLGSNYASYSNIRLLNNDISYLHMTASTAVSSYSNIVVQNNFFHGGINGNAGNSGYSNIIIQNNVMSSSGINNLGNSSNVLIDHNLLYSYYRYSYFNGNCRNLTLTNNIFNKGNFSINQIGFSSFRNNITFDCNDNEPWASFNNTNSGGNIANTDPQMAAQTEVNKGTANPLLDFTIASGSANNAGTDGKDLGVLYDSNGSLNWNITRNSRLPIIVSMNVTTPTVAPGSQINVEISAKKNNL